jgi:hypothetical protein
LWRIDTPEDSEQLGFGMRSAEPEFVVTGGDARDEAQHTDQ